MLTGFFTRQGFSNVSDYLYTDVADAPIESGSKNQSKTNYKRTILSDIRARLSMVS